MDYLIIIGIDLYLLWDIYRDYRKNKIFIKAHYFVMLYLLVVNVVVFFPKVLLRIPSEILLTLYHGLALYSFFILAKDIIRKIKEKEQKNGFIKMMLNYLKYINKAVVAILLILFLILIYLLTAKSPRNIILDKTSGVKKFEYSRTVDYRGKNTYQVKITDIDSEYFILKHAEGKPRTRLINKHVCCNGDAFYKYYEDYFLGIKVRTVQINKSMKYEDMVLYEANLFKTAI